MGSEPSNLAKGSVVSVALNGSGLRLPATMSVDHMGAVGVLEFRPSCGVE